MKTTGGRPVHVIAWAPADYLTSRTRMRAITTQDHMLRLVYHEILDVLYAERGEVKLSALGDLLALPQAMIDKAVQTCVELGSLTVADDVVRNPRVTRTLEEIGRYREHADAAGREGGRQGGKFGKLGGRPRLEGNSNNANGFPENNPPRGVSEPPPGGGLKPPPLPLPLPLPLPTTNEHTSPAGSAPALSVLSYWSEKARTKPRSKKVEGAMLKRIAARFADGFAEADLKRCVDVACADEFYVQRGYYKQPDVIFRNAERVASLLSRLDHARSRPIPL